MIRAEGATLLENELHIFSCVGGVEEAIQCPAGAAGLKGLEGLSAVAGQAHRTPRGKGASWSANQPLSFIATKLAKTAFEIALN